MAYGGFPIDLNWPFGRTLTEGLRPSGTLPPSPQAWQAIDFNQRTTSQVTYADILAAAKNVDEFKAMNRRRDRMLFRFNGTLDQFKAALIGQGIEVHDGPCGTKDLVDRSGPHFQGVPAWGSYGGLEVHELFGAVWIGTRNAIKALKDGIPFAVVGGQDGPPGSMDTLTREDSEDTSAPLPAENVAMNKTFPILKPIPGCLSRIPWDMIAPHENQALRNHDGQSLEGLARRGGLDYSEALAVLRDERFRSIPDEQAAKELAELVSVYAAQRDAQ